MQPQPETGQQPRCRTCKSVMQAVYVKDNIASYHCISSQCSEYLAPKTYFTLDVANPERSV